MPNKNVYEILGTGFSVEIRMPTLNMYEMLGTGFSMEIRMPLRIWMKYWALDENGDKKPTRMYIKNWHWI